MAKSHFVPKSYLSAWVDPDSPPHYEPFVHVFSRDAKAHRRRAPSNIFFGNDYYVLTDKDGNPDKTIETRMSAVERLFAILRRSKLERHAHLTTSELTQLRVFLAFALTRSPAFLAHHMGFWRQLVEMGEELEAKAKASPGSQIPTARFPRPEDRKSLTLDQVRLLARGPDAKMLPLLVPIVFQCLSVFFHLVMLRTNEDPGFITSDQPAVLLETAPERFPAILRSSPGFGSRTAVVTMPVSPTLCLLGLHQKNEFTYLDVNKQLVAEINRVTRNHCADEFVVRRKFVDPYWMNQGILPGLPGYRWD